MQRGWRSFAVSIVALGALGLGACGEDEPDPVSQQAYDDEVADLCEQHGAELAEQQAALEAGTVSGAEEVSFYQAEYVPRIRAIVTTLDNFGFPADKQGAYQNAVNRAFAALDDIDEDTISLLDRRDEGLLVDSENPFLDLENALGDLDVTCG